MIVFPMAGLSRRFTEHGYGLPKFQLPIWDGYVFDYAVSSFATMFSSMPFLFIYRETGGVRAFIESRARLLGIKNVSFAELSTVTAGQAETVELGLDIAKISDSSSLTIFNIDTFRRPDVSPFPLPKNLSGWLEIFYGEGDNWSFVKPDLNSTGLALQTTEKIAISNLCSNGLYYFSSVALFRQALANERSQPSASELYIAPMYNHLISRGHTVGYGEIAPQDLVFCGVPSEYEALLNSPAPWKISKHNSA